VLRPAYDLIKAVQAKYGDVPALKVFRDSLMTKSAPPDADPGKELL